MQISAKKAEAFAFKNLVSSLLSMLLLLFKAVSLYNGQRAGYFGRGCKNRRCDAVGVYCEAASWKIIALPYDDESEDVRHCGRA